MLDKLYNPSCNLCPLYKTAKNVCVPGEGPQGNSIMLLGRNPGRNEDAENRPFVGQSGQLIREAIKNAGLAEEAVFITNLVKCFTPDNRPPTATEIEICTDNYLTKEIAAVEPKFIFAFGNEALSFLTGKKHGKSGKNGAPGILSLIGQPQELGVGDMIAFPMPHPSWIIRQGGIDDDNPGGQRVRREFMDNFQRYVTIAQFGTPEPPPIPEVVICDDMWKVQAAFKDLDTRDVIAFDCETQGLWPGPGKLLHTIQLAGEAMKAYSFPIEHPETPQEITNNLPEIKEHISQLLTTKKTVAQYSQFDKRWWRTHGGRCRVTTFDTKYACHLLNENVSDGLKAQGGMFLNAPPWGIDMTKADTVITPLAELGPYGGLDAAYTWQLRPRHIAELKKYPKLLNLFRHLTMPAVELFTQIEENGIAVDWEYLDGVTQEKSGRLKEITDAFYEEMPGHWNWDSDTHMGYLLYNKLNLPVLARTQKTGMASVAGETIQDLLATVGEEDPRFPLLSSVLDYSSIRKLQGFFAQWKELCREDNRLHATYNLDGAVTGRTSSRAPNLQQIPRQKEIRRAFIARPGWKLLSVDYSQAELRLIAEASQDPMMLAVFADPHGDIHRTTAAAITEKSIDMVDDEDRRKAKPVNFGYCYSMREKRFQLYARYDYGVYLTIAECQAFRDRFFETYAGLPPWHEKMMALCKEQGYVESFMGRRRRPDKIYSTNWEERGKALRQAINSPIQAGASDLTVFAALQLPQNPDEIIPVAFGHDSFLYEVREDVVDYWQPLIKTTFEGVHKQLLEKLGVTLNIPLVADVVVGDSWAKE